MLWAIHLQAQEEKAWSGFGIENNWMAGKVLKHTAKINAHIPEFSSAVEFNFIQNTFGKKDWHIRRGYPTAGVSLIISNYGGDFGSSIGLVPNLEFAFLRKPKIEWVAKVGFGVCYATKPYSRAPNFDTANNAIGSHFNNKSLFTTDVRYHINEHWDVQLGANFTHISNAALRQPNFGINMYGAHIGIRYFPVTGRPKWQKRELPLLKNRWMIHARYSMSWVEYAAVDGPLYPVYLGAIYTSKRWWSKNKAMVGIDASYHTHIAAFLKNNEIEKGHEAAHSWRGAVFAGNEFMYGRVGLLLQIGVYFKQPSLPSDKWYQKLGGNFYLLQKEKGFLKECAVGVYLKTHKAQAELSEFALTVGF